MHQRVFLCALVMGPCLIVVGAVLWAPVLYMVYNGYIRLLQGVTIGAAESGASDACGMILKASACCLEEQVKMPQKTCMKTSGEPADGTQEDISQEEPKCAGEGLAGKLLVSKTARAPR